jgi:DNA-directed RNA polymerase subunit RPC12/RpoP
LFSDISLKTQKVPEACPHCGNKLSPWQQVLLATDRALICKKCWYRIIIDVTTETNPSKSSPAQSSDKQGKQDGETKG